MGWSQPVWLRPAEPEEVQVAGGEENVEQGEKGTEGELWTAKASS